MSLRKLMAIAGVVSAMTISVGVATAQDITFYNDKNGWQDGFTALTKGASEASGLNVKAELLTPTDKYQAFIQSSVAGGNAPPIFTWWNGKQLEALAETGAIAPLTEAWDKAIADGNFSQAERELVTVDGKPYAALLNVARWPVLYNKHAFEKAGIAAPPKTWEELLDACEKLKAAGYVPFNAPNVGGWMGLIWFSEFMIRTSPDAFVGLTDGTVPYNGPEVQKAFQLWTDFYAKGYYTDPREQDDTKFFVNQQAAMFLIGEWMAGSIADKGLKPGEDFGAFIMPTVTPDVPNSIIVEAAPIVVSQKALADNPNMAKVVDYLMTPEATDAVQIFNGNLKAKPTNAIIEEVNNLVAEAKPRSIVRWWEAVPADLQGDLVAQMGAFMLNPTADNATKVMNDMESLNADYWASR
ncbi:ABC transporter substrate-binding protein [Paradevosia shaoguanensis]|uniref:ABC transporter substrate-binding protein n=1 Tax=Paradevosia shaoguanensis TaxID=1335043 RepID=UPI0019317685|nr:extracellular solute-binding protein [Paradevosia shaoguanensis]